MIELRIGEDAVRSEHPPALMTFYISCRHTVEATGIWANNRRNAGYDWPRLTSPA